MNNPVKIPDTKKQPSIYELETLDSYGYSYIKKISDQVCDLFESNMISTYQC